MCYVTVNYIIFIVTAYSTLHWFSFQLTVHEIAFHYSLLYITWWSFYLLIHCSALNYIAYIAVLLNDCVAHYIHLLTERGTAPIEAHFSRNLAYNSFTLYSMSYSWALESRQPSVCSIRWAINGFSCIHGFFYVAPRVLGLFTKLRRSGVASLRSHCS